jgi:hypothetical protein
MEENQGKVSVIYCFVEHNSAMGVGMGCYRDCAPASCTVAGSVFPQRWTGRLGVGRVRNGLP